MFVRRNRVAWLAGALVALAVALAGALAPAAARADEGGVSFWLPGQFGSLAATPSEPGWSLPLIGYHASVDAAAQKEFEIGGRLAAGLAARADLLLAVPTYTFAHPVLGGQAALGVAAVFGRMDVSAQVSLSGPAGSDLTRSESDAVTSYGDLFPSGSLRWNRGVHNSMVYTMLGVPVGSYEVGRLANLGTNHWSADAGGGYTYLNPVTGRELSLLAGATYSFENPDTDYKNGESVHLDWGASQFLSESWHVGLVGYYYLQVTGDSGAGARLGDFESRVGGIGPQVGHLFKMGGRQAYLNVKGYWEFDARHRAEGWNGWITLLIPLGALSSDSQRTGG